MDGKDRRGSAGAFRDFGGTVLWLLLPPLIWVVSTLVAGRLLEITNIFVEPTFLSGAAAACYAWDARWRVRRQQDSSAPLVVLTGLALAMGLFLPTIAESM